MLGWNQRLFPQAPWERFVPNLVEEMCERVNVSDWNPVQTAAYLLWRVNWIPPFRGGNGRTSRALAYLAFCIKHGSKLPGKSSLPDLLVANRTDYILALQDADIACNQSDLIDVSMMENLLDRLIQEQLATRDGPG